MKILFCTNVFEVVENGPVKFANLLLRINELYAEHEIRILTEDVSESRSCVHKVRMATFWRKSPVSQFVRMGAYHREAMRVRKEFPFDVLVYNNALVGLWSAVRFPHCVGMINDYKLVSQEASTYETKKRTLKERVFRLVEKTSVRFYEKIITNSEYLTRAVVENYPQARGKVHRLYKGIELPEVPLPRQGEIAEPVKILFIKTDYELGGLLVLIDAIAKLPYRVVLTVVGPRAAHQSRIEAACRGITHLDLRYRLHQPQEEVLRELQKSHIFCVPSYKEALGVANLEAMAYGVPVVSSSAGGIPEVLDGERCGWLVPPGDASALALALQQCIERPDLRTLKTQNACEQARRFSIPAMFQNFLTILARTW